MKKQLKRALALGLTLMISLAGAAMTVSADDDKEGGNEVGVTTGSEVILTKKVMLPKGLTVPVDASFTFDFDSDAFNGDDQADIPAISSVTIDGGTAWTLSDTEDYYYATIPIDLGDLTFSSAGIYTYIISEVTGSDPASGGTMTYSQARYIMEVHVTNDEFGPIVSAITIKKTVDDNGSTDKGDIGKSDLEFVNSYSKLATLTIDKVVEGDYGDQNKEFTFTLTVSPPEGVDASGSFKDPDGNLISFNTAYTFTLKHSQSIEFTDIPVGSEYTVSEEGNDNYVVRIEAMIDGILVTPPTDEYTSEGEGAAIGGTSFLEFEDPIVITDGSKDANAATFYNKYIDPPTPTGIILNNLPFVLLILVSIGGFTSYIALKRRNVQR